MTLRLGKNERMRGLVSGEGGAELARTGDTRAGHVITLLRLGIDLLKGLDNQRMDQGARLLSP